MNAWLRWARAYGHELLLAAVVGGLMFYAWRLEPAFVSVRVQQGLYSHVWDIAILALPMTLIIITGGIDLSVGSIMALASVTLGILHKTHGWPIGVAAAAAILVGLLCGIVNGWFVAKIKVHPLIVTLATFSLFRGLAEGLSLPAVYSGFPEGFTNLGQDPLFAGGAPALWHFQPAGWLFIAAAFATALMLAKTPFGRGIYAIGFNETAARFSGIDVDRSKLLLYSASGLAAGLVSVNYSALRDNASASVGAGIELNVITAVVLGGTSIFGGRGTIIGTILGVALIHETRQFVGWRFNRNELISIVLGLLLIVTVAANALLQRRAAKR